MCFLAETIASAVFGTSRAFFGKKCADPNEFLLTGFAAISVQIVACRWITL